MVDLPIHFSQDFHRDKNTHAGIRKHIDLSYLKP